VKIVGEYDSILDQNSAALASDVLVLFQKAKISTSTDSTYAGNSESYFRILGEIEALRLRAIATEQDAPLKTLEPLLSDLAEYVEAVRVGHKDRPSGFSDAVAGQAMKATLRALGSIHHYLTVLKRTNSVQAAAEAVN
jgi:hypothetical protein